MRVVAEIPHKEFKITAYSWKGKYLIKFEKGMYEQTYKLSEMDVAGDQEIKRLSENQDFLREVMERFKQMNNSLNQALNDI